MPTPTNPAWLSDDRGNKASIEYFGSQEAAQKALDSLDNCDNCTNCSRCSDCSDCSRCSVCSGCSRCSGCSDCSRIAWLYNRENLQADASSPQGEAGPPPVPVIENIHQAVYTAASQPRALEMRDWHTCAEIHCRAGWVVTLAGEAGKKLEAFFDTTVAAMKIYDASSPLQKVSPVKFFDNNADTLADMKRMADLEAGQ